MDSSLQVLSAGSIARVKISADLDGEESETGSIARGDDPPKPFGQAGLVVAVDGPSGAGKSSASRGAAVALGVRYLDTGALYRALTWWLLEQGVDTADAGTVGALAGQPVIEVGTDPRGPRVRGNGTDVVGG